MILLVDNYDSFTYNIVQYFQMAGSIVRVVNLSSGFSSTEILQNCGSDCQIFFEENSQSYFQEKQISADGPQDAEYQRVKPKTQVISNDNAFIDFSPTHLVIGPGPGKPSDSGFSKDLILKFLGKIPILGICLGHQCIGEIFGGTVLRAKKPMHGKISKIKHDGQGIFKNMPKPFFAARYHSLIVDRNTLPCDLIISGETEDGEIMALRHKTYVLESVQFHPESVATEHGLTMIQNFLNLKI